VQEELDDVLALKDTLPWSVWYERYLRTGWWRSLRLKVLLRDGHACVRCKSIAALHVDHMKYSGFGSEQLGELQTLCSMCHDKKTKRFDLLSWPSDRKKVVVYVKEDSQLFTLLRRGYCGR